MFIWTTGFNSTQNGSIANQSLHDRIGNMMESAILAITCQRQNWLPHGCNRKVTLHGLVVKPTKLSSETIQIYRFRGSNFEKSNEHRKIGQLEDVSPGFRMKSEDIYGHHHSISGTKKTVIPSGKRLHNYGRSPCSMGKSTISMAMFKFAKC